MATISNHQAVRKEKRVTPFSELAPQPDVRPEALLKLSNLLQSTLDFRDQLGIFFREMNQFVLIDGLRYTLDSQRIQFDLGTEGQHSCTYRLTTRQSHLGELIFTRNTRFREHELANIEAIIGTLVYPLRNGLEYQQAIQSAMIDPLTGAANRIAMEKNLAREVELAKRYQRKLSILMLDLDHFKKINDTHGHTVGDQVLKKTVETICSCIRQTDMCFRFGGEEFVIALNNASITDANHTAQRIINKVPQNRFDGKKGVFDVTVSIGAAQVSPSDTLSDVLDKADQALYQAKSAGRNTVILADEEKVY